MLVASLLMYDRPDVVQRANDALWAALRDRLRARGLDVPETLDRSGSHDSYWLRSDLIFGQTCGYPYVEELKGRVRLVAAPAFRYAGGKGARRASFVVVRDDDPARSIADLAGKRAAINDWLSNSGMNLLRITVAPHAKDGRFFSDVIVTGGHMMSIAAIREGRADVAAVKEAAASGEIEFQAPEGLVKVDPENQHTWKTIRIGQVNPEGLIDEVYASDGPVQPDPYLKNIPWAAGLAEGMSQ